MTLGGAAALGLRGVVGEIAPGVSADLVAIEADVAPGQTPAEAFVDAGGRDTTQAVMCAGTWRVHEGKAVFETNEIDAASAAARDHALALLAQTSPR